MAFNHRKLDEPNGTDDDDSCRFSCISYLNKTSCIKTCPPHLLIDVVTPPPPLSYGDQAKQSQHLSPIFIILIAGLGGVFLLASYYMILVKYCRNTSRRRRPPQAENTHEDFLDENHGPGLDNPIWYITTVGLQQSVINSIAICKYKKGEGLIEGTDCSVCLSEFQEDETLRLLPKCSHAFHLPCIDTWLTSHKNCPLCRAPIVSPTDGSPLSSAEPNYSNSGSGEVTQVENFATNGGFGNDPMSEGGVSDISIEVESEVELQVEDGRGDTKEVTVPYPHVNGVIQVLSDLGDKHRVVEDGIQPLRRSVSIDSSSAAMIYLAFAEGASPTQSAAVEKSNLEIAPKQSSGSPNTFKLMGSSSGRKSLQKRPLSMKRSLSCSRKFLLSRYSRSRNSILPL